MSRVLIAAPTHDGRRDDGSGRALYAAAARRHECRVYAPQTSLLAAGCNLAWVAALNAHEAGRCDWFAMLHSDVTPDDWWVDTLVDAAEAAGADMVSAAVALKDRRGLTSTALSDPVSPWLPFCRLTVRQVLAPDWPVTFGLTDCCRLLPTYPGGRLLVNTGCCVVRLGPRWPEAGVWFQTRDRLTRTPAGWSVGVQSEDWVFSRKLALAGGAVFATTAVRTRHRGCGEFGTHAAWGDEADAETAAAREGAGA